MFFSDKTLCHYMPFSMCLSPSCHFFLFRKGLLTLFSPSAMTSSPIRSVASMWCLKSSVVFLNISPFLYLWSCFIPAITLSLSPCSCLFCACLLLPPLFLMHLAKPKTSFLPSLSARRHLCLCLQKTLTAEANVSLQNQNQSVTMYSWKNYLKVFTCRGLKKNALKLQQ